MSRKIDALVAEKVMGWKRRVRKDVFNEPDDDTPWMNELDNNWYDASDTARACVEDEGSCREDYEHGWFPSEDISAAWEVVEKMREISGVTITASQIGYPTIHSCMCGTFYGGGNTAMLAICLAALRSVGVTEDEIADAMKENE